MQAAPRAAAELGDGVGAAVVDDENVEMGIALPGHGVEARLEQGGPIARADDDGDVRDHDCRGPPSVPNEAREAATSRASRLIALA